MYKIGDVVGLVDVDDAPAVPVSPERWYLLRTHPGREFIVSDAFMHRGISHHLPTFVRSVWAGGHAARVSRHRRTVRRPLFPGVILVPDFEADIDRLKQTGGVAGWLRIGDQAAAITPKVWREVRDIEAVLAVPPSKRPRRFEVGQLVRIADGPLHMWIGRIERLDAKGRLRVLIAAAKRAFPVEVAEDEVEPV